MTTIMMTGAGAPGMPGILKCMSSKRSGIRLIGADADANAPSRKDFDRFHQIPMAKDPGFVSAILGICEAEKVDLLVPVVTRELAVLAANREAFEEQGTRIAVMDNDKLTIANNKGRLFNALEANGIRTAPYKLARTVAEVEEAIDAIGKGNRGVVVKPVEGNGSRGVRIIDRERSAFDAYFSSKPDGLYTSKEELIRTLSEKAPFPVELMVMKLLPGKEYSVDIVAMKGRVQAAVCRVGLTVVSSNQTSSVIVDEPKVLEMCEKVVRALGLSGNIGFDLKEDEDGEVYILEINPRLTGGIVTCLAAGANMPWLGIQSWLGEEVQQPKLTYGVKMQRYWNESFFDAEDNEMQL